MAAGPAWPGDLTRVPSFLITACITLVTGTMFLMWLGEQITERGIGNGISMIILAGIVAGMPGAIAGTAQLVNSGEMSPATAILMLSVVSRRSSSWSTWSARSVASR